MLLDSTKIWPGVVAATWSQLLEIIDYYFLFSYMEPVPCSPLRSRGASDKVDIMTQAFFPGIDSIRYEGPTSENPLAFRYYDKDRMVLGKSVAEHLRCAVCYWHSFAWPGSDVFGAGTFDRPWFKGGDPLEAAELKLKVAFEFFEKLGAPFYTFHDRDMAPEGATLKESHANLDRLVASAQREMTRTGVKLLWGTANLFSHPRYMSGAATNPDPEVFTYAAAQVRKA